MFSRFCYLYHCIFVLYCTAPMFLFYSNRRIINTSMMMMMMMTTSSDATKPAWSGFCMAVDREILDTFVRRCKRLRYSDDDIPEVAEMFESTDRALSRIIRNDKHVLQHYLPEHCKLEYNLRPQQHSKQLLSKTTEFNNRDYIVRMLYKDAPVYRCTSLLLTYSIS